MSSSGSLFLSIPDHIVIPILNRVSQNGFEFLGPLMVSGKEGMALALQKQVLKAVSLVTFEESPVLVNKWTKYRPFFVRCVKSGNPRACYLESLRLATREGKIDDAINLLLTVIPLTEEMEFARLVRYVLIDIV